MSCPLIRPETLSNCGSLDSLHLAKQTSRGEERVCMCVETVRGGNLAPVHRLASAQLFICLLPRSRHTTEGNSSKQGAHEVHVSISFQESAGFSVSGREAHRVWTRDCTCIYVYDNRSPFKYRLQETTASIPLAYCTTNPTREHYIKTVHLGKKKVMMKFNREEHTLTVGLCPRKWVPGPQTRSV